MLRTGGSVPLKTSPPMILTSLSQFSQPIQEQLHFSNIRSKSGWTLSSHPEEQTRYLRTRVWRRNELSSRFLLTFRIYSGDAAPLPHHSTRRPATPARPQAHSPASRTRWPCRPGRSSGQDAGTCSLTCTRPPARSVCSLCKAPKAPPVTSACAAPLIVRR